MGRHFFKQISPFWLDNRDVKCETRLDGAWGEKQVWRPHVHTWDLSEPTVLFYKKCLWHYCDFLATSSIRRPRKCAPLSSRYVSGAMQQKSEIFSKKGKFSNPNVINFYFMNICSFRTQYGVHHEQTANKSYWRHFRFLRVVCHFYACPTRFFFGVELCLFC